MAYKLVAIDLDDTLLDNEGGIPERAVRAIHAASEKGVRVVLCTGRVLKGMKRYHDGLGLDTLIITAGGAEVYAPDGTAVFSYPVDPALVKQILSLAYEHGLHAQVYIGGNLVYKEKNGYAEKYEGMFGAPGIVMPDIMEQKEIITPKVLYIAEPEEILEIQRVAKERFPGLAIKRSKPEYLEFMQPGVSKGEALRFVANYYGIDLKDVIAMGDGEIDIPMIEAAGLGVAVENANAEAKKAADIVCASNECCGAADVIEKYILEEGRENEG